MTMGTGKGKHGFCKIQFNESCLWQSVLPYGTVFQLKQWLQIKIKKLVNFHKEEMKAQNYFQCQPPLHIPGMFCNF